MCISIRFVSVLLRPWHVGLRLLGQQATCRREPMSKRLLFLSVGLFAILAWSTPSHADLTQVTDNSTLGAPLPAGVTTITELDVTFTPAASPFTGLTLTSPPTLGGSSISSSGDTVKILISPSASAGYILLGQAIGNFSFDVPLDLATAMADITVTSTVWKTNAGNETGLTTLFFTALVVPEPNSLAILGAGMLSLLAAGRLFKRSVRT
jgi:hypothetical protein